MRYASEYLRKCIIVKAKYLFHTFKIWDFILRNSGTGCAGRSQLKRTRYAPGSPAWPPQRPAVAHPSRQIEFLRQNRQKAATLLTVGSKRARARQRAPARRGGERGERERDYSSLMLLDCWAMLSLYEVLYTVFLNSSKVSQLVTERQRRRRSRTRWSTATRARRTPGTPATRPAWGK